MKIQQVDEIATQIYHAYEREDVNLTSQIRELSVTSDLYVMMQSNGVLLLFTPEQDSTLPVYKYKSEVPKLVSEIENNNISSYAYKFTTNFENYDTLAYCKTLPDNGKLKSYLFIFTPLYPVNSTVSILRQQLITVTIISLILAFILSVFLSNRISNPLTKITLNAKKMGKGDYDITFDTDSPYTEINNLSSTLNRSALELGRADNLQKDLIANVSHDLKTPLTLIRSYSEKIRDLSGDNKEKRDKDLEVIINETERMAQLVTDMAEVSKLQNKKIELNLTVFDLAKEIRSIMESYKILENEGYIFEVSLPRECYVEADETRIKQVVQNLVGNAIKYSNGNRKEITVKLKKMGRTARFDVIDKGLGIPKEDISHIWDRYYRTSSNYQRPEEGSGLGLSIVKETLTLHNAEFGVRSELKKGSDFWFEIETTNKK